MKFKFHKFTRVALALGVLGCAGQAFAAGFAGGDLVVTQVGAAVAVALRTVKERPLSARIHDPLANVQTLALPTVASGGEQPSDD